MDLLTVSILSLVLNALGVFFGVITALFVHSAVKEILRRFLK